MKQVALLKAAPQRPPEGAVSAALKRRTEAKMEENISTNKGLGSTSVYYISEVDVDADRSMLGM